ncbi:type I-E CRISPR-associated endoribonuclease Cas2 [Actinomadura meridiana]|uniref:type I-E CRISPR-associated endoribonuclease Cas2 n=1 Tax=Actinomadura meridiana TaxID=559626 RepID=UPI0031EFEF9C
MLIREGAAVLVHPATTEQGFTVKTAGERRRRIADFDGLQLVRFLPQNTEDPTADPDRPSQSPEPHAPL